MWTILLTAPIALLNVILGFACALLAGRGPKSRADIELALERWTAWFQSQMEHRSVLRALKVRCRRLVKRPRALRSRSEQSNQAAGPAPSLPIPPRH